MNQNKPRAFPLAKFLALIVGIILIDQVTKISILNHFLKQPLPQPILPIFDLVLVWNRGVSWGMFNNLGSYNALIFSFLSGAICLVLGVWLWRAPTQRMATILSLIIGGAIGNLIDRIRWGAVVDFLHFHWHHHSFPAFNIADAAITIGVGLMIWHEFISKQQKVT